MWHSTACHNTSGQVRVAGQNRWVPWWFNAQYGGGEDGYGVTGWINREDLEAMPPDLQPLFSHLCVEVSSAIPSSCACLRVLVFGPACLPVLVFVCLSCRLLKQLP